VSCYFNLPANCSEQDSWERLDNSVWHLVERSKAAADQHLVDCGHIMLPSRRERPLLQVLKSKLQWLFKLLLLGCRLGAGSYTSLSEQTRGRNYTHVRVPSCHWIPSPCCHRRLPRLVELLLTWRELIRA